MSKSCLVPDPCSCVSTLLKEWAAGGWKFIPLRGLARGDQGFIPCFAFVGKLTDGRGQPMMRMIPYKFCPLCGKPYWKEVDKKYGNDCD